MGGGWRVRGTDSPSEPSTLPPCHSLGVLDSSIRVDVGLLDKLMNLVGELVLARNQILQFTATPEGLAVPRHRRSAST